MDRVLAQATSQWNAMRVQREKELAESAMKHERQVRSESAKSDRRRLPEPPPGWGDTDDAARSSMLAAKMLKRGG